MKFGDVDTGLIAFGDTNSEDCYCSMEERFLVNISTGKTLTWFFNYISLAVCNEDDSESWNDNPPTIDTDDPTDIRIIWDRRKRCGNCTQEECGNTKVICRDSQKGSGALYNTNTYMTASILQLDSDAKNNPSKVLAGLLNFVEDFMRCEPGPGCKRVSKLCSTVTPPPPK
jgi:hypothetical protein